MDGLKADLKEARNLAYLGKYAQSQKLLKGIIDSIEQEIILNNIPKKDLEAWRQVESGIIAEKNAVEGMMYMISGLSTNNSSYVKDR